MSVSKRILLAAAFLVFGIVASRAASAAGWENWSVTGQVAILAVIALGVYSLFLKLFARAWVSIVFGTGTIVAALSLLYFVPSFIDPELSPNEFLMWYPIFAVFIGALMVPALAGAWLAAWVLVRKTLASRYPLEKPAE